MGGGLTRAQAKARAATVELVQRCLPGVEQPFVLVACSGGADSMALAATAAFLQRKLGWRCGAVVIDHQLQEETALATLQTVEHLKALGLEPVFHRRVDVHDTGDGLEAAARDARYEVFAAALQETGAHAILLGHTKDDQAEQVLLGLMRGSGTRSLAGIPEVRGQYLRPLLDLTREEILQICEKEKLSWWEDPTNTDPSFLRNTVRHRVLPVVREQLGESITDNLARTAVLCRQDADLLDAMAQKQYWQLAEETPTSVELDIEALRAAPAALQGRIIGLAAMAVGAEPLTYERVVAVQGLLQGSKSAGPVELAGFVNVWRGQRTNSVASSSERQNPAKYGKLVFISI